MAASYDTLRPSFEYGGTEGKLNYFVSGSYEHNGIGIENPVGTATPIHDDTDQYKMFTYLSYLIDDTSRVSLMGSVSYSDFQVPNAGRKYDAVFCRRREGTPIRRDNRRRSIPPT